MEALEKLLGETHEDYLRAVENEDKIYEHKVEMFYKKIEKPEY